MSAITDKAREFWDRISPRERRLVVIAAIALPLTIAAWLGLAIHDGLVAMERRIDKERKALDYLADVRTRGGAQDTDDTVSLMGTEPLSLDTYLDNAAKKAKFQLKETKPHSAQPPRNGFVTNSVSASLDKLTIEQVRAFLSELETASKVVAVTKLDLQRDFREKDKLRVDLEVSTYSKEPPPKSDKSDGSASGSDAKKGS